jgi:hypothetical protein
VSRNANIQLLHGYLPEMEPSNLFVSSQECGADKEEQDGKLIANCFCATLLCSGTSIRVLLSPTNL